jgi:hypothetical protein
MAFLNDQNMVVNIAIFEDEQPETDTLKTYSEERPAGIGYTYDEERDAFIPPQPYESWVLNEDSCLWESPVPHPTDGERYVWDEDSGAWVEVEDDTV